MTTGHYQSIQLGGKRAVALFAVCLFAFVTETQLSQYVQAELGFEQPYLLFYIVHSAFAISFPLHVLYLSVTAKYSVNVLYASLAFAVQKHLAPRSHPNGSGAPAFPTRRFSRLVTFLTAGMTVPSLLWFIAVALAPVTDVTALWNTNAFFAYVFTVLMTGVKWDVRRLTAVLIATTGALAVVYGGSTSESEGGQSYTVHAQDGPKAPLVGDVLTLSASVMYGAYQVLYKSFATLPNDPEAQADGLYAPLPHSSDEMSVDTEDGVDEPLPPDVDIIHPLPFGLYPNLLTSAIGICTLSLLWFPIPILHALDIEPFALPRDGFTYCVIAGIALSGAIFNAGFMVLLGVWGPIVTSVGNLLTIVLVFLSDAIFGAAADAVTIWSVLGCGSIVVAFAILAYDMMMGR